MSTKYKRIRARIERDKIRRKDTKRNAIGEYDNFDNVITFQNYVDALRKCNKGVGYKYSTQEFNMTAIEQIHKIIQTIESGTVPSPNRLVKVVINERGKERIITPIIYYDRITQRVLCDNALVPCIGHSLIYDNGASTKGKGVDFARKRILHHLRKAVKHYGNDFYVLVFDFKSFFDSIEHSACYDVLNITFEDDRIVSATMDIIKSYPITEIKQEMPDCPERIEYINMIQENKGVGICLGSQISQVMALSVPNKVDHLVKDKWSVSGYERYMDDGVLIHKSKKFLQEVLADIIEMAKSLGLKLNLKKTRIVKAAKGFTFLKVKYFVSNSGKIIRKLVRTGIVRMRRKLKKFKGLVDAGKMSLEDVYASMQSWLEHARIAKSYQTRKRMLKLYDELFGGYKITRKYRHRQMQLCTAA